MSVRCVKRSGQLYVGVTSAMRLVKTVLGEPEDYFGPQGNIHAAEGEGCHRITLDWIAYKAGWIPEHTIPTCPEFHPDPTRWESVIEQALKNCIEFVQQYEIEPIGVEQEDFSKTYGLVGHIDLPCYFKIPARRRMKGPVDFKFAESILESHKLQVRAYGRLDGMRGSQLGGIFHSNRNTGRWEFRPVSLVENLDDFKAITHAAGLWAWKEKKKG